MLLETLDPPTGLTRDRANFRRGEFENVSAGGLLAAATVMAERLGFVTREPAIEIVDALTNGLDLLPRHKGPFPHFAEVVGSAVRIKPVMIAAIRAGEPSQWPVVHSGTQERS